MTKRGHRKRRDRARKKPGHVRNVCSAGNPMPQDFVETRSKSWVHPDKAYAFTDQGDNQYVCPHCGMIDDVGIY